MGSEGVEFRGKVTVLKHIPPFTDVKVMELEDCREGVERDF